MSRTDDMSAEQAMRVLRIISMNYAFGHDQQKVAFHKTLIGFAQHDDLEVSKRAVEISTHLGLEQPIQSHHLADPQNSVHNLD
ncbi:MAG: hypothetical protein GC137_02650 [Alphaproteobacteria bacterium]|nr:hypothetical protein [Alphaproteobacteria bacterium]